MMRSEVIVITILLVVAACNADRLVLRRTATCPPVPTNCPCGVVTPEGSTCKRCKINCPVTTTTKTPTTTTAAPSCPLCYCGSYRNLRTSSNCPMCLPCATRPCGIYGPCYGDTLCCGDVCYSPDVSACFDTVDGKHLVCAKNNQLCGGLYCYDPTKNPCWISTTSAPIA